MGARSRGAALRLVPKSDGQTFYITLVLDPRLIPTTVSPRGHARWYFFPSFCPSHFHLPAYPSLHGRDPFPRYYGRSDSRQPDAWTGGPSHPRAPAGLPGYLVEASSHSISSHPRVVRSRPAVRRFGSVPITRSTGFALRSKARPTTLTESSSRWATAGPSGVTDWSFSFRGSPPRVATAQ